MKRILIVITLLVFLFSCSQEIVVPSGEDLTFREENPFVGYWAYSDFTGEVHLFTRANDLPEDQWGFAFSSDGSYRERANSGFCGTPPVSYATYEGSWSIHDEDELILEGTFWGGEKTDQFEIVSVDEKTLKLKYLPL